MNHKLFIREIWSDPKNADMFAEVTKHKHNGRRSIRVYRVYVKGGVERQTVYLGPDDLDADRRFKERFRQIVQCA